ncbi:putative uncharacterized protein GUCA1ANB [Sorex araneus]|uniref:putative uncharacterized protein GUCA1ANB n=1 Tax=Sorex araneus TaxID=42254 RepID=UPI002433EF8A|nr:putative uncharacterized protein GUCA1ANB [Sorex araneus]
MEIAEWDPQKPSTSCPGQKTPPGGGKEEGLRARRLERLGSHYLPVVVGPRGARAEFTVYSPQYSNSLSPFYTLQKPTCGYLYSRAVDHSRKRLDVPPANLAMWQS